MNQDRLSIPDLVWDGPNAYEIAAPGNVIPGIQSAVTGYRIQNVGGERPGCMSPRVLVHLRSVAPHPRALRALPTAPGRFSGYSRPAFRLVWMRATL